MQEVGRCHAGGSEREAVVRSVFVETGEHHSAFFRAECTHPLNIPTFAPLSSLIRHIFIAETYYHANLKPLWSGKDHYTDSHMVLLI